MRNNKINIFTVCVFICNWLGFSVFAQSNNLIVAPMVSVAKNKLEITTNQFGGDNLSYTSVKAGFVTQFDDLTVKFSNERSISDVDVKFNPIFAQNDLDVKSIDINAAYSLNNGGTVFVGYLNTDFSFKNDETFKMFGGSGTHMTSYAELGFYAGLGYTFKIAQVSVNTSVAYANLDASYTDNFYVVGLPGLITEGDTTGFSYSISWQSSITQQLAYSIGLFFRNFEYDSNLVAGISEFPGLGKATDSSFDSKWDISSAALTVIYVF